MLIASAAILVQLLTQSAQGPNVQIRAVCVDSALLAVPCPVIPQFLLSKKTEPGPVWTAAPFKQHGDVMTFKRTDRHAIYNITVTVPGLVNPYALAYVDGRAWRFDY